MNRIPLVVLGLLLPAALVQANGPRKQSAPVDLVATVHGIPHSGQALGVDIKVTPRIDVPTLHLTFVASAGLALSAQSAEQSFGQMSANESRVVSLQVTPQATGIQLLSVVAEIGGVTNGATRRTVTIELPVDLPAAEQQISERKATATDSTGQKIHSMRGTH